MPGIERFALWLAAFGVASAAAASAPETSFRPVERSTQALLVVSETVAAEDTGLADWLSGFRDRAMGQGISASVFDRAMAGVRYDADVIRRDRNQAEFTKTVWDYLDTAVSDLRVENGRAALSRWRPVLDRIEATYGVEKEIITAIWGLESAYGTFRGSVDVLSALATLAYDGRRAAFFENELLQTLKILQSGDTTAARLKGSWAGAMGHTQFMPSSYQSHAVDFDGDGRRNIWEDDPTDALASTAAYLKHFGWTMGQPWGVEVRLPEGFDYTRANRETLQMPSAWAAEGISPVGAKFDDSHGTASILLPGGAEGAAFMIFSNFAVIEKYNTADAYVIGVGHLADRIAGKPPFAQSWPRRLRALTKDERIELQKRLTAAGFDTVKIDAKMGPLTVNAVRRFQQSQGITPDGYPSLAVLDRLRAL